MTDQQDGAGGSMGALVRAGANLPAEQWADERIAAVRRFMPQKFNDTAHMIMFLSLARRYDLDPFAGEVWGWESKGKLVIMTGRDGLSKKLRQDPRVMGFDLQVVYAGDTFLAKKMPNGKIELTHESNPFTDGSAKAVGGYFIARMKDEAPDVLITRRMSDYAHLQTKDNWKMYAQDMILTRCLSAGARMLIDLGGIYTEADFHLTENGDVPGIARTQERIDALAAEVVGEAEVIDVEVIEDDPMEGVVTEADGLPPSYTLQSGKGGWYVPLDPDGNPLSDTALRESDAVAICVADFTRGEG